MSFPIKGSSPQFSPLPPATATSTGTTASGTLSATTTGSLGTSSVSSGTASPPRRPPQASSATTDVSAPLTRDDLDRLPLGTKLRAFDADCWLARGRDSQEFSLYVQGKTNLITISGNMRRHLGAAGERDTIKDGSVLSVPGYFVLAHRSDADRYDITLAPPAESQADQDAARGAALITPEEIQTIRKSTSMPVGAFQALTRGEPATELLPSESLQAYRREVEKAANLSGRDKKARTDDRTGDVRTGPIGSQAHTLDDLLDMTVGYLATPESFSGDPLQVQKLVKDDILFVEGVPMLFRDSTSTTVTDGAPSRTARFALDSRATPDEVDELAARVKPMGATMTQGTESQTKLKTQGKKAGRIQQAPLGTFAKLKIRASNRPAKAKEIISGRRHEMETAMLHYATLPLRSDDKKSGPSAGEPTPTVEVDLASPLKKVPSGTDRSDPAGGAS
jgi:hypothetical protein